MKQLNVSQEIEEHQKSNNTQKWAKDNLKYIYVDIHTYIYIYIYIYYIYIYLYIYTYTYIYTHTHTYIYIYIYIYLQIHIHTYMYICIQGIIQKKYGCVFGKAKNDYSWGLGGAVVPPGGPG